MAKVCSKKCPATPESQKGNSSSYRSLGVFQLLLTSPHFQHNPQVSSWVPCQWWRLVGRQMGTSSTPALTPVFHCSSTGLDPSTPSLDAQWCKVAVAYLQGTCPAINCLLIEVHTLSWLLCYCSWFDSWSCFGPQSCSWILPLPHPFGLLIWYLLLTLTLGSIPTLTLT